VALHDVPIDRDQSAGEPDARHDGDIVSRAHGDVLQSASAEAFLAAEPAEVYSAACCLAAELWSVDEDAVIVASPPHLLVHAVVFDDEVNCWLTWETAAIDAGVTRIRLGHDEADSRPAPDPELEQVIAALRAHLQRTATA
jgi:hypothetical protein